MLSIGYIKEKAFIYDNKYNKKNAYLIKGDKVIILDVKKALNNKWYQIYFKGKKNIIGWVNHNKIEYLSVPSKFLTQNK